MTFLKDDLLDDEDEDQSEDSDSQSESDAGADPKSTDKRIRDLQSKADKETARANKAEAALKKLVGGGAPVPEDGKPADAGDVTNDAVLDMARMFAFQQHPRLQEYGITASDLNGRTPREIAESAAGLVAQFEKFETRARNKVLAEQGLAPEIEGGVDPKPGRDFSKMSKEDFDKVVAEALKG